MSKKIQVLAFSILLTMTSQLFAEMYRYIDENGQVVYSQFKPKPDVETSTVKAPPPPPSTAGQSRQELIDSMQKREDAKQAKKEADRQQALETETRQRQQKNCESAKNNLEALMAQKGKIVDKEGNEIQLSDKQREQEIEKARNIMKNECR